MSFLAMLFSIYTMWVYVSQQTRCKVIFYSIDRHQVVAFIKGCHGTLCVDKRFDATSSRYAYHVQPSQEALNIASSDTCTLEEAVQCQSFPVQVWNGLKLAIWQGKKFIFIDKRGKELPYLAKKVYTDFLVIEENALTTLQPLFSRFDFGTLVIGASNNRSLAQKLQEEALQHRHHSHSLLQQGALIVSW